MAIVEMWWGSSEYGANPGLQIDLGPTGYTLAGSLHVQEPATLTAHYFIAAERMKLGSTRCASQPTALFSGQLTAKTTDSLIGDGDPRITVKHVLRQRVYLAGKQVAQSVREVEVADLKGDGKSKSFPLTPLAFEPVVFSVVPNTELRVDLVVELDPWYHKTRLGGVGYQALLQLPQWGLISGVA